VQIGLRAKGAVIPSHQLAYVGVPFDSSDVALQPLAASHHVFPQFATNN
jgi:hypothetical protein